MPLPEDATCLYCHKILYGGRTDRRFCNDTCRNTFNRKRRLEELQSEEVSLREKIITDLRKNHELLLKFNPSQRNELIMDRYKLHQAGFSFNYYTGIKQVEDGKIAYYCFDQFWVELEYGMVELGVDSDIS